MTVVTFRSIVALLICAATVTLAPAAVAAPVSKATLFQALGSKVACGIEIHPSAAAARDVLCAAAGIPAPRGPSVGDPGFVQISASGVPRRLRLSQDSFVSSTATKLRRGRLWNRLGVTCHVAQATVMCFNSENHGFVIGNGRYISF